MRGVLFGGGRQTEDLVLGEGPRRPDPDQGRAAVGQGAGLVEGDRLDPAQLFQDTGVFDDDAAARGTAHAAQERHRSGDQQRARGGHHQHLREPGRAAADDPADRAQEVGEGRERNGIPVREPHHGRLAVRGFLDQGHDAAVLRVLHPGRDLHPDRGLAVEGAAHQPLAGDPFHRQALPGERGFVEAAGFGEQDAVQRHHLTRPHQQDVADLDVGGGDILVLAVFGGGAAVAFPVGRLRDALQQGRQFFLGPAGGVVLQGGAAGHHQDNDHGGDVLADEHRADDRGDRQDVDAPLAADQPADHADGQVGRHGQGVDAG